MNEEYILTNGKKYIRKNLAGKYEQVSSLAIADTFESYKIAKAIWKNALSKMLRNQYYVAKIENGTIVQCDMPAPKRNICKKNDVDEKKSYKFEIDNVTQRWIDKIENFTNVFDEAKERLDSVSNELSIIDQMLSDLVHIEEDRKFNAIKICKLHYMRSLLRKKRRSLKNEKRIIDSILSHCQIEKDLQCILKNVNSVKEQVYVPRVLDELFENDDVLLNDVNEILKNIEGLNFDEEFTEFMVV